MLVLKTIVFIFHHRNGPVKQWCLLIITQLAVSKLTNYSYHFKTGFYWKLGLHSRMYSATFVTIGILTLNLTAPIHCISISPYTTFRLGDDIYKLTCLVPSWVYPHVPVFIPGFLTTCSYSQTWHGMYIFFIHLCPHQEWNADCWSGRHAFYPNA